MDGRDAPNPPPLISKPNHKPPKSCVCLQAELISGVELMQIVHVYIYTHIHMQVYLLVMCVFLCMYSHHHYFALYSRLPCCGFFFADTG